MIEKLRESRGWQLLLVTILILIVPLVADIGGRIGTLQRTHQEITRLEEETTEAQAENAALEKKLEYVTGDEYLEEWARGDARLTKPGEVAIIPLPGEPSPQNDSSPEQDSPHTDAPRSIPEQWHALFFGDAAPQQ